LLGDCHRVRTMLRSALVSLDGAEEREADAVHEAEAA
jgi:hypothetical protein